MYIQPKRERARYSDVDDRRPTSQNHRTGINIRVRRTGNTPSRGSPPPPLPPPLKNPLRFDRYDAENSHRSDGPTDIIIRFERFRPSVIIIFLIILYMLYVIILFLFIHKSNFDVVVYGERICDTILSIYIILSIKYFTIVTICSYFTLLYYCKNIFTPTA